MPEFTIKRLGHHGDGIIDGPIFAGLTLPGEVVTGDVTGNRLADVRIVKPSSDRVSPPCRHFKTCGGCQLQHASDAFLRDWKTEVVKTALAAVGLAAEFLPMHVSPEQSRRRAKFAVRRTKKGATVGFHARASDAIIDIPECRLVHPGLMAARPLAQDLARVGGSRKQVLGVMATYSLAGLDVQVTGGKPVDGPMQMALAGLAGDYDLARLCWEDEVIVERRHPEQTFESIAVTPPPGAFLQSTAEGEQILRQDVEEIVSGVGRVADLFAGCGTFALPLARTNVVHAVEGESALLDSLDKAWRGAEGLKSVSCETRDLFRRPLLPDELKKFDAVVIDPPRAGAEAQVSELAKAGTRKIAYVSCNPSSFARDARILVEHGYELGKIRVVDQFRWSSHVELVAGFTFNPG